MQIALLIKKCFIFAHYNYEIFITDSVKSWYFLFFND